jgi:hypothetical protein
MELHHSTKFKLINLFLDKYLRAFSNITLTIAQLPDRVMRHVTPLTPLQVRTRSVELLGLSPDIYRSLAENSI